MKGFDMYELKGKVFGNKESLIAFMQQKGIGGSSRAEIQGIYGFYWNWKEFCGIS